MKIREVYKILRYTLKLIIDEKQTLYILFFGFLAHS